MPRTRLIAATDADVSRPAGVRFGTLVHAVLAAVDLRAASPAIEATVRVQGRLVGASSEEVEAAVVAVERALAHPVLRRAAKAASSGALRREMPVMLRLPDGVLAEGVDLAFRESSRGGAVWTVVDFKADRELAERRRAYEVQVRLYAAATGEGASGVLLCV